jgi:putative membrane protein
MTFKRDSCLGVSFSPLIFLPSRSREYLKKMKSLPTLNACLNALSAILLIAGYLQIKKKNIDSHKRLMLSAFSVSVLFLISYLIYHYNVGSVPFTGQGWIRPVYFAILISHTILAALVPFMAVITLYRAFKGDFERHRRIARWTFPIWMYVSTTGVAVYLMLYLLYPSA